MKNTKTAFLTKLALFTALLVIFNFTPLGFLRIGPVEITFMTIPVIIGGIMLGVGGGAILGLVFGILSALQAPTNPIFGMIFASHPVLVIGICLIPRILVGVVAGLLPKAFQKKGAVCNFVTAIAGCLTNTVLFLGSVIVLLNGILAPKMIEAGLLTEKGFAAFWATLGVVNGLPEAIVCTLVVMAVMPALQKIAKRAGE